MQITWMLFDNKYDVNVNFTNDKGTDFSGMVTYLQHSKHSDAWIAWQEFYAPGNMTKDIRYVLTLPELKEIERVMNEALKHPDGPNAHTMKLYYYDTL
jgi:hypothetical protein